MPSLVLFDNLKECANPLAMVLAISSGCHILLEVIAKECMFLHLQLLLATFDQLMLQRYCVT